MPANGRLDLIQRLKGYKVFTLRHGNMFRLYIQPSSDLKEISPGIKVCPLRDRIQFTDFRWCMEFLCPRVLE